MLAREREKTTQEKPQPSDFVIFHYSGLEFLLCSTIIIVLSPETFWSNFCSLCWQKICWFALIQQWRGKFGNKTMKAHNTNSWNRCSREIQHFMLNWSGREVKPQARLQPSFFRLENQQRWGVENRKFSTFNLLKVFCFSLSLAFVGYHTQQNANFKTLERENKGKRKILDHFQLFFIEKMRERGE